MNMLNLVTLAPIAGVGGLPSLNAPTPPVDEIIEPSGDLQGNASILYRMCEVMLANFRIRINNWLSVCNARSNWTLQDKPPGPPSLRGQFNDWRVWRVQSKVQPLNQMHGWNVNKHIEITCMACQKNISLAGSSPCRDIYRHIFECRSDQMLRNQVIDLS